MQRKKPAPKKQPAKKRAQAGALNPPASLTADEIEEWNRVIAAVEKNGRTLKAVDRSLLVLYVRTWVVNQLAHEQVAKNGSVTTFPNKLRGASADYKTFVETAKLLQTMLTSLGCTPASRDFDVGDGAVARDTGPLKY